MVSRQSIPPRWRSLGFVALLCTALLTSACTEDEDAQRTIIAPNTFALSRGFAPDPRVLTGMTGGPVNANERNSGCRGWITTQPSHPLVLSAPMPHLRIVVHSTGDPTLVVLMADGTYRCNDDSEGLNSMVEGSFPAGTHQIFVGSYGQNSPAAYSIGVTQGRSLQPSAIAGHTPRNVPTPPPQPPSPPSPPRASVPPPPPPGVPSGPQPVLSLTPRFSPDPRVQVSWAGGTVSGSTLRAGCVGHLPVVPQHTLVVRRPLEGVRILVSSAMDTTLLVRGPDGVIRCNDDTDGLNPAIDGPLSAGAHQVFVGTYGQAQGGAYQLGVTTNLALTSAELASLSAGNVTSAPPVQPPDRGHQPPVQLPVQPPPPVQGGRVVPGMMPGDMNPTGLTPQQRVSADATGLSYYEAREFYRCATCMRENDFDHCIYMCREPCLDCLSSSRSSERTCGPPCGGRRTSL